MTFTVHRGIISSFANKAMPAINFLEKIRFQSLVNHLAITAVRFYQHFISPYKGFTCAHAKLNNGVSCSTYFKDVLTERGLSDAFRLLPDRLQDCQQSYQTLRDNRLSISDRKEDIGEQNDIDEQDEPATQTRSKKNKKESPDVLGNFNGGNCSDPTYSCDVRDCDSNHDGSCDVSDLSCDPGGCDNGSCDGGDLNCDPGDCNVCDCNF